MAWSASRVGRIDRRTQSRRRWRLAAEPSGGPIPYWCRYPWTMTDSEEAWLANGAVVCRRCIKYEPVTASKVCKACMQDVITAGRRRYRSCASIKPASHAGRRTREEWPFTRCTSTTCSCSSWTSARCFCRLSTPIVARASRGKATQALGPLILSVFRCSDRTRRKQIQVAGERLSRRA